MVRTKRPRVSCATSWPQWLTAFTLVLACAGSAKLERSSSGALQPGGTARGPGSTGPFRVVFAGPEGTASEAAEISIVFDRALRPLEAATAEVPPITVTPALPGKFRWLGARALSFAPELGRLPAATSFTVEVPASVRAADGSALGKAHRFSFTTPRPKVVNTTPYNGETGVLLEQPLVLELNQAVNPQELTRHAKLSANGRPLAFRAERAPDVTKRIAIVAEKRLPADAEIRLELDDAWLGEEGPLPSGTASSFAFRTFGPLRVNSIECNRETPHGRCAAGSSVGLTLTNPVRFAELKRKLHVEPALPLEWPHWYEDDSQTSYVEVPARLAAGERYTVVLEAGLKDVHGQSLAHEYRGNVTMDDYYPRVSMGLRDGTLLASESAPIPIFAVNVPAGSKVRAAALSREDVLRLTQGALEFRTLMQRHKGARDLVLPQSTSPNTVMESAIDPGPLFGNAGLGVLGLYADYTANVRDHGTPSREKLAKVSDLALGAKVSRHGSLLWLTRLSSAEAVSGAEIELVQGTGQRRRYRTNADGIVDLPASEFAPKLDWDSPDRKALFFASAGPDWNYEKLTDLREPWGSGVPVDLSGEERDDGLVFTDRGVYRPGESVAVKGIVRRRTPEGNAIPKDATVTLTLKGPSEEQLRRVEARVSRWGTFHATLRLPPASGLGTHWLNATLGRNAITAHFDVEEYRPAEFRVDVSTADAQVRGERARFDVAANTLFGTPLAGADVRYSITRVPTSFSPPGADALVTDASLYYADLSQRPLPGGPLADASAQLDAMGRLSVEQLLSLPEQRQTERVLLEAEVTDTARQTGSGRASVLVHPADFYVGLEPIEGFVGTTPSKLQPKVAALTPKGERLAGKRVELELLKRSFTSVTESSSYGPVTLPKVIDHSVARCTLTSTQALASCALTIAEPGYHVIRARSRDARGNPVEAATSVYALGDGPAFYDPDPTRVELVLDKPHYRVGERARVLVKSPFPEAEALITVERSGILSRERRTLRGALPWFEIPVTERHRPNAFIGVHLVRKMPKGTTEGAFRFGYVPLRIDPEEKRLAVEVVPNRRELGPGDEVEVQVRVKDASQRGKAAEVTLYAVDEGALLLTGYQVPDPLPVFNALRPLEVGTLETRANMAQIESRALQTLLFGKGAEGGGGGDGSARRDFKQTAYFNPSLTTDKDGNAHVKFRLPESLSRYRVMAVAVGDGEHFGFGQSDVTTSKRLMLRPALPRFVRSGDRFEAGVVVNTKGLPASSVTVRAKVSGLHLEGPSEKQVQLRPEGSEEVRFAFRAGTSGRATFSFEAVSGKERDAVAVERVVSVPTLLEAVSVSGETQGAIEEQLGDLRKLRTDAGGLELSLAPTALVGLESTRDTLRDFPFGCTEQLASRLVPTLVEATLFGKSEGSPSNATFTLVRQILARQRHDGGFGFWEDAQESHAWVSAYALLVLGHAKQSGLEIPERSLSSGIEYLRRSLANAPEMLVGRSASAFMVDVLASLGAPDVGYANRLFEERAKLPEFARASLLAALAQGKSSEAQIDALVKELEGALRVTSGAASVVENSGDEYAVLMDSTPRTQALVLRAFLLARPKHALIPALARGLLAQRRNGTFGNTQESAFALLAFELYRSRREQETPAFEARVRLASEAPIFTAEFQGRSFAERSTYIPMARLTRDASGAGRSLVFEREGRGTLFYQARLSYARNELPKQPLDAGFFIEKGLYAVDPGELGAFDTNPRRAPSTHFRAGDLVVGELVVVNAGPHEYVAVEDPLPAGFEAVNASFLTTATRYDLPSSPEGNECPDCPTDRVAIAEGRAVRRTDARRELHDDRVAFLVDHLTPGVHRFRYLARATSFGTFVVPPSRVFDMYEPEVFGHSGATSVEVR